MPCHSPLHLFQITPLYDIEELWVHGVSIIQAVAAMMPHDERSSIGFPTLVVDDDDCVVVGRVVVSSISWMDTVPLEHYL